MKKIFFIFLFFIQIAFSQTKFAVIGDYGYAFYDTTNEASVANLIKTWNVDFIITTGDNNYELGESTTIDANIGKYYHEFIYPYNGIYGSGSPTNTNRFFPSLGNHDWYTNGASAYLDYFTLPGNERYYDFVKDSIHFFALDSDPNEPDGVDSSSTQGQWLKNSLAISFAKWKIVYFHHPPYSSSSTHGSTIYMQWPFKEWGATAVLAGHDHTYERLLTNDFPYFVNGLGGKSIYNFGSIITGSQIRYNGNYGAMLCIAGSDSLKFQFINIDGTLIDEYVITNSPVPVELVSFLAKNVKENDVELQWNTATEINNYGFEIQKSINNNQWQRIGFVEGKGISNKIQHYTYVDKNFQSGKYFYRLKQIDRDGSFKYSKVVEVFVSVPKSNFLFQNYPNPFNSNTIIEFFIEKTENVTIKLYDVLGKEITIIMNEKRNAGKNSISFNAASLPSGMYFYKISTGKFIEMKKMILMK